MEDRAGERDVKETIGKVGAVVYVMGEAGRRKGVEEPGKLMERKFERNGPGRLTHSFQMEHSVMHSAR